MLPTHPFLPSRRWERRRIAPLLGAILLAWLLASSSIAQKPPPNMPASPVVAAVVERRDLVNQQTFVGSIIPTRTSVVGSPVEGYVTEFFVVEGDYVKAGDSLAQLRLDTLKIRLSGAEAELVLLQKQHQDLTITQPAEIRQAKARMDVARALESYATSQSQRIIDLSNKPTFSKAELEELASMASAAVNTLDERTAGYELMEKVSPVRIAQADARIRMQEEIIRELKDTISLHTIVAPFDGYITAEHTEVGQWINQGGPVVEVVELNEVEAVVPVLETYVSELKVRTDAGPGTQTKDVEFDALPGQGFEGEVVSVVPNADIQSRSFPVKIRLKNRPGPSPNTVLLKPGMFARVTLPVRTMKDVVLVPTDALVLSDEAPRVWIVTDPDQAKTRAGSAVRQVTIETSDIFDDEWVQVCGPVDENGSLPLKLGDVVISEGNERVHAGMMVRVVKTVTFTATPGTPE